MFTTIEDAKKGLEGEFKFTQSVFDALTDESLSQAINDDHRTIGRMAWHIITTYPEMIGQIGIKYDGISKDTPMPSTASEISKAYAKITSTLLSQIENWTDDMLHQEDDLYGEKWKKGSTLLILIKHEVHHRGQITVLMRQAGIKVPDIYGPAKEGWAAYNAPPPEI